MSTLVETMEKVQYLKAGGTYPYINLSKINNK